MCVWGGGGRALLGRQVERRDSWPPVCNCFYWVFLRLLHDEIFFFFFTNPFNGQRGHPHFPFAQLSPNAVCIIILTPPPPLRDILSGCCFFIGPWTVTRSSLRLLCWAAVF